MTVWHTKVGLLAAVFLSACGTPQEQCIRAATRGLGTIDRLIAETNGNLRRGYAYETVEITRTRWVVCEYIQPPPPADGSPQPPPRPRYCLDDITDTEQRPVAIDPAAERRKLEGLIERRRVLNRQASAGIDQCKAQYPEG